MTAEQGRNSLCIGCCTVLGAAERHETELVRAGRGWLKMSSRSKSCFDDDNANLQLPIDARVSLVDMVFTPARS